MEKCCDILMVMLVVEQITQTLSFFTLLLDGVTVLLVGYYVFAKIGKAEKQFFKNKLIALIAVNARLIAFGLALSSMLGSLFYSDIAGFEPCTLCWYQRIAMYPLVLLLGIAIATDDKKVTRYANPLAAIGALLAGYQYYLQVGGPSIVLCSAEYGVSCSDSYTMNFGYITIPMMALSVFVAIFLVLHLYQARIRQLSHN